MPEGSSWPDFRAAASESGMMSSLSLPLTFGGRSFGALNLYSREPHAFHDCRELGLVFAAQAGVALAKAELRQASERMLHEAAQTVRTADVVSQALDILVEQRGCTREEAIEMLRQHS